MSASSDRNLLFGVLALQTQFVEQAALVAAMRSWAEGKERSLGEILQQTGAISEGERSVLEMMVQKHLERHNHDPSQSLSAVKLPPQAQDSLSTIGDADFQESLAGLAAGMDLAAAPDDSTLAGPGAKAQRLSKSERFEVLGPLAQGGLGEVLVARDEQLQREVALKRIRDQFADDLESRSRFVLEAEVTGGLEHPGIVPVYTLGYSEQGRPYYIMRLIRGESLQQAIQAFHRQKENRSQAPVDDNEHPDTNEHAGPLALHKLLRRFVDACNAVAYAQSRGVLHRDIKPHNIMLGPYGETLVVDWGLAKVIGRQGQELQTDEATLRPDTSEDTPRTQVGTTIGTPAYMSPEQAMGMHDSLSPASDVYSLGATLYAILTGKPPFTTGELASVLAQVQGGEFTPPRKVNPSISPALEAVCLKAMSRKAKDRYASAQELAEDVERWLADEPVSAWREPFLQRASRWVRRHQTLVTGAGAAAAVALAGLLLGVILLGEANLRERAARRQADQNYRMAKSAVDAYLTKVSNDPRLKQHDLELLRRDLLDTARQFYDRFLSQRGDDPALQSDRARAYGRLAQITAELGDESKAIALLEEAKTSFESLMGRYPQTSAYQTGLAIVLQHRGDLFHRLGRFQQAESELKQAVQLFILSPDGEPLPKGKGGEDLDRLVGAAYAYNGLGSLLDDLSRYKEAEEAFRREAECRAQLIASGADLGTLVEELAANTINLANFYERTGRYAKAQAAINQAIDQLKQLQKQTKTGYDAALRANLASAYNNRGKLALGQGEMRRAEDSFRSAADLLEKLVQEHPLVVSHQTLLAVCRHNLGAVLQKTGQLEAAEESYRQALELRRRLHKSFPGVPYYQKLTADTFTNLGEFTMDLDRDEEAEAAFREALSLARDLADRFPDTPESEELLASTLANLAGSQLKRGRLDDALAAYQQALKTRRKLVERYPQAPRHLSQLAGTLMNLGLLNYQNERWKEARVYWTEARENLKRLTNEHPQVEPYKTRLLDAYNQLASLSARQGLFEEAEKEFQAAKSLWEELLAREKDSPDYQYGLASTLNNLANLYDYTLRFETAAKTYGQAIQLLSALQARYPKLARYKRALAGAHEGLGLIRASQGKVEAAQAVYDEVIAIRRKLADDEPQTPQYAIDLSRGLTNMADLLRDNGRPKQAIPLFDEAINVVAPLKKDGRTFPPAQSARRRAFYGRARTLALLGRREQALSDWNAALAENPGELAPLLQVGRIESLINLGRLSESLEAAETLANKDLPGYLAYGLATVCSLASAKAKMAKDEAQHESGQKLSQEFVLAAIESLRRAHQAGFFKEPTHLERLSSDPLLAAIRSTAEFQALVKKVRQSPEG